MFVYVYKEHSNSKPYCEETLELFENEDDAKALLKRRIESFFNAKWEDIKDKYDGTKTMEITPAHVRYTPGCDRYWVWNVEERKVRKCLFLN